MLNELQELQKKLVDSLQSKNYSADCRSCKIKETKLTKGTSQIGDVFNIRCERMSTISNNLPKFLHPGVENGAKTLTKFIHKLKPR